MARKVLVAICASAGLLWSTAFAGVAGLVTAGSVTAGSVIVPGIGGDFRLKVNSFENRRFNTVMRQQYDFSCGSAAIASLLSFHYEDQVTEHEVFTEMLALADEEKVRQQGFSMLDMKRYLQARGYQADGFSMPLAGLRDNVRLPMIVLLNIDGFRHFVLIKGISADEVLVGDPARGLKIYSYAKFKEYWNGSAFIIRSHLEQGRSAFLGEGRWPQIARAPIQQGLGGPSLGHTLPYWPSTTEW